MIQALRRTSVLAAATATLVVGTWLAGPSGTPTSKIPTGVAAPGNGGGDGAVPDDDRAGRAGRGGHRGQPSPTASPDGAATSPTSTPSATPSAPSPEARSSSTTSTGEERVIVLVNQHRAAAGCGPVRLDTRLQTAARAHSRDMATKGYFSHTGADGSTPWDRARRAGYTAPSGENIAMGQRTADEVMRDWMNSDGHRRNILNCNSRAIGVGVARNANNTRYWTQMFGYR